MSSRGFRLGCCVVIALLGAGMLVTPGSSQESGETAYSLELTDTIDPATEAWVDKALDEAKDQDAKLAIIRLDTPGGLDSSMRAIVKDIIAAPMPVVVYVSPNGARAASAGLFVTEAADVAAMAPQTNIGSASPISIGGGKTDKVLGRKIRNDAAAYVRALAEGHGRNPDLAERMVRDAVNVPASDAKSAGLIDLIAANEGELLKKLDGFEVKGPKAQTLDTEGVRIERHDLPLQYRLLQLLVNPTIAFLLLSVGLAGIAIEILNPGLVLPGSLGGVCLLLGLYGTAQLPVTVTGIALMVLAVVLIVAEAHVVPTHGALGAAGVVALVAGGLLLFDTKSDAFEISAPVVIFSGLLLGGFGAFLVQKVIQARHAPVRTGWEELVGAEGEVRVPLDPVGQVFVEGALWRARPVDHGASLEAGYRVRVESVDGLTLFVKPVERETESEKGTA